MTFTFSYETVALIMFASMGLLMLTGQRVFGAIGFVGAVAGAFLWGTGGTEMAFNASMSLMNWFPMITLPLFIFMGYIPLVKSLGFDPIWYGVLYTITCQIAYMTPPFGYNLFLMKAMAPKEITLADIYSSIVPFVGIMLVGLVLVMLFPGIAMYLPDRFL